MPCYYGDYIIQGVGSWKRDSARWGMENGDLDRQIRKCSARWGCEKSSYKNHYCIYLLRSSNISISWMWRNCETLIWIATVAGINCRPSLRSLLLSLLLFFFRTWSGKLIKTGRKSCANRKWGERGGKKEEIRQDLDHNGYIGNWIFFYFRKFKSRSDECSL